METPLQQADLTSEIVKFEGVKQEIGYKKQTSERALLFLENPLYADTPLSEMKDGLLQLL